MNRIVLWYSFVCCLVVATTALAQEDVLRPHGRAGGDDGTSSFRTRTSKTPVAVGIDAGINYSFFSQDLSATGQPEDIQKIFESGTGIAPFVNAYLDIGISRSVGIQLKIGYDAKKFGNDGTNTENCSIYQRDEFGNIIGFTDTLATVDNEYTVSPSFVALGVLARIDFAKNFVGTIGPIVHFSAGKPVEKITRTIQSPDSCYFNFRTPEQSRTLHAEGDVENSVSPRFGMELGVGYKIPLAPSVALVPKVGFQFFFSKAFKDGVLESGGTSDVNTQLHSVQFSIGLLFGL